MRLASGTNRREIGGKYWDSGGESDRCGLCSRNGAAQTRPAAHHARWAEYDPRSDQPGSPHGRPAAKRRSASDGRAGGIRGRRPSRLIRTDGSGDTARRSTVSFGTIPFADAPRICARPITRRAEPHGQPRSSKECSPTADRSLGGRWLSNTQCTDLEGFAQDRKPMAVDLQPGGVYAALPGINFQKPPNGDIC